MPGRPHSIVAVASAVSLIALSTPVFAQSAPPIVAASPAATPAPPAAGVTPDPTLCDQLGLSPESESVTEAGAVTETGAVTAGRAKAAGTKISAGAGGKQTTGNSAATPNSGGSSATRCALGMRQARTDQASINRAIAAKSTLQSAGQRYGVDWRILAAIGVRESNFRNVDASDGGWGVFQLTRQPGVSHDEAWNLSFSANYAAKMFARDKDYLARKFPNFTPEQLLQATAASYNFGTDDIRGNPARIDIGTTGNNYGANVLNLRYCFG